MQALPLPWQRHALSSGLVAAVPRTAEAHRFGIRHLHHSASGAAVSKSRLQLPGGSSHLPDTTPRPQ
ncbi:hypothetical protein AV530_019710 [Patagioenas fasciata monilis]|uniref:Uncharacterized protein n=1 Tax=Patagioenas fasciata monilis TaxID=372326 RepID=A0A1V4JFR6_PATFA|nr:hypothetical protein AV530_019710 [Patagioenas fasciata monilis]